MSDLPLDRRSPSHTVRDVGPSGSSARSSERLWGRIRRPVDPVRALQALTGVPHRTAREVVGAATAGSEEATTLVSAMPLLVRNLSIATTSVAERCVGEVRGPVLWSQTLSARAATAGDPGLFVCQTVSRAYDTHENRLLAHALRAIIDGARQLGRARHDRAAPEQIATAHHNADLAARFLDHRTLISVHREPDRRRALVRMRQARRREYAPVLAMLDRAAEPLDAPTLGRHCDDVTAARHDLLVAVVDHLEARGVRVPPFLVVGQSLVAGPVRFRHPALTRPENGDTGVFVGPTRLDVVSGSPPSAGHVVVGNRGDVIRAVDAAILADDGG